MWEGRAVGATTPRRGLTVQVESLISYAVATVEGSVDFGTHALLEERLTHALTLTRAALIVDMAGVEFCDSSGLSVFARMIRQTRVRGVALVVVGLHGRVANVFAMTRMDHGVYLYPDLESAVRWLETGQTGQAGDAS